SSYLLEKYLIDSIPDPLYNHAHDHRRGCLCRGPSWAGAPAVRTVQGAMVPTHAGVACHGEKARPGREALTGREIATIVAKYVLEIIAAGAARVPDGSRAAGVRWRQAP